ncbi:L-lactate permease [soil metagenome]
MRSLLAALPILAILLLMLAARWSAARAGVAGVAISLAVALLVFDFPDATLLPISLSAALAGTAAEAGFTALTILWIIGPALGIHQLQLRTGAADVLRSALSGFAPDPRILALLVAWFFVLFMEGAAGFGASVALAAPFLVAAGFRPIEAVSIALIGHVVGVSFGAIGTPVIPQVAATGLSGLEIARATGLYHSLLGWFPLIVMLVVVQRTTPGVRGGSAIWGWATVAFLCFVVPYTLLWAFVGPELPTLAGALFGGVIFVILLHFFGRQSRELPVGAESPPRTAGAVLRAASPYLVLVAIVLMTRLVGPLQRLLREVEITWELGGLFSGSMQPLYHPGSMLLISFLAGAVLQRASLPEIGGAFLDATRRLVPVTVALTAMLLLSRIMVHAGMTSLLASTAAASAGSSWPVFAPFVGMLGTFVTGSATASNILFTEFQRETALAVGLPVAGVVGVQGFGAAVGNMICPHNVVAAGATVGLEGREGEILRRTLWVTLVYTSLGGLLALVFVR